MTAHDQQFKFPPLPARYHDALNAAATYIAQTYNPQGLVACGSIIRGNPGPSSDFDLYVIHDQSWRQRVQRWFNGVPTEIFINPPERIERYFEEERSDGRPMTAHMLATGWIMLDRNGAAQRLQTLARQVLQQTPDPTKDALLWRRYGIATIYEDAVDIAHTDPENTRLLLSKAVDAMFDYAFLRANRNIPRHKELIAGLATLDPELEHLARRFFQSDSVPDQIEIAGRIADLTVGARGFFEWESPRNEG